MADKFTKITDVEKGKRLSYFWDYYKIPLLVIIIIVCMCASLTYHIFFKPLPDTNIFIATVDKPITTYFTDSLEKTINDNLYDIDGDGTVKLKFDTILTSLSINVADPEQQSAMATKFASILSVGKYIIEIVDEEAFNYLLEENLVADYKVLEEYGYDNKDNFHGFVKIPIENTSLGTVNGLDTIPNQLYLTFRAPTRSSDKSGNGAVYYQNQVKFFISLLK